MITNKKHLIKRAANLTDDGNIDNEKIDGRIVDIKMGRSPSGTKNITIDDTIYLAESGYAIYGKANVKEIILKCVTGVNELLNHFFKDTKATRVDNYFYTKLKGYYGKSDANTKFFIREILLDQGEVFEIPYILEEPFLKPRQTYFKLEDDFDLKNITPLNKGLSSKITGKMRREVFGKYNLMVTELLIDIDHHVPKSIGGPGNIIENLIPMGANYNRAKSNSVPSFLFQYAKENYQVIGIKIPESIIKRVKVDYYPSDKESLKLAKRIVSKINEDYDTAKKAYKLIKDFHFQNVIID